ncbi:hypothetical protein [Streptomyces sp. NBRC 110611]|uniref:hypothetical protein n=1 Tax=Streptomyces sp. NBRC 110611 TaxID=1621259 RepID=UPI000835CA98|nr:hypothetical protein [Streptomyces sp. NBRC 110611]
MRSAHSAGLRHVLAHLLTPLLMCVGMGFAYLGAFAHPAPHHLPVAVVGPPRSAQLLAQSINDRTHGDLEVRTVGDRSAAVEQLKRQDIFGAYVMDAATGGAKDAPVGTAGAGVEAAGSAVRPAPELLVATAGSDTSASAVQKVFTPIAAQQGAPLKVTDVVPTTEGDPTGQGLFFLLVAISIGSYASVAVIGGAGAVLPLRLRVALASGTSFVVSLIGTAFAGPVFHLVDHGLPGVWGMAWLYSAGILLIGTGLHTFLKRWTTLGVMALFVMLNFTSSGGVFRPELQNGFFAALHSFWNGAGFLEGARSHVYFDGYSLSRHVWTLALWLVAGLVMAGVAGAAEKRRRTAKTEKETETAASAPGPVPSRSYKCMAPVDADEETEEELEEAVGV